MTLLILLSLGVAGIVLILVVMRRDFNRDRQEQKKEEHRELQDSYYD